jgi:hypothetical protein
MIMTAERTVQAFTLLGAEFPNDSGNGRFRLRLRGKDFKIFSIDLERSQYAPVSSADEYIPSLNLFLHSKKDMDYPPIVVLICEFIPDSKSENGVGTDFKVLRFGGERQILEAMLANYEA